MRHLISSLCLLSISVLSACAPLETDELDAVEQGLVNGLSGAYFSDTTLSHQVTTRVDAQIDFAWAKGAPVSGVGADNFSVRWTGFVLPAFTESYTFVTTSDDGVRLWVNGALVIDNWTNHAATDNGGVVALKAGVAASIRMEFFEKTGDALARLSWKSPSQARQVIPSARLSVSDPTPVSPKIPLPGRIDAASFDLGGERVAYHDTDATNRGGAARTADGVDVMADAAGALFVGYIAAGEWLAYSVNVAADADYRLDAAVLGYSGDGGRFHLTLDGADVTGLLTMPTSGAWTTVVAPRVHLSAGAHQLRFVADTNGTAGWTGNLKSLTFATVSSPPVDAGSPPPVDAGTPPPSSSRLFVGVVLMNSDDNSIPYMNGFGGGGQPVALHITNFGGVETFQGGWDVLKSRIDKVNAAGAMPVIHAATVPRDYSKNGTSYGIENHWDPNKVASFASTLGPILAARGVKWVVFGNEGKESNYFTNDTGIDEYIGNFKTFEATLRPLVPGVQIYAPYTTGGITQAQQDHAWSRVIDALGTRMDGLAWDNASGSYDGTLWKRNQDWLNQKDPSGRIKIWITEWYPGQSTNGAQNAWQVCYLATLDRYVMANFWAPNGDGMAGAILWNRSSGGGAGKTAIYPTVSQAVSFVQHRPVTMSGDTFTNALGQKAIVNRGNNTVVFQ